jgi:hypothetical protein
VAKKKEGDLRLLKDGVVFGPTDREGLDRLLAAGRVTLADHVSLRNADWVSIAEFLSAPAAPAKATPTAALPAPPPKKKGDLRILSGGRVVSSLTRGEVEQLRAAGRIGGDDLVCALNGPWMPVGNFLAPPPPVTPQLVAPQAPSPPAPVPAPPPAPITPSPSSPAAPLPVAPVHATVWSPPLIAPYTAPRQSPPAPAALGYALTPHRPPPPLHDDWYVRVRGIHSAPLRKHHVKALYQAREITLDCVARHPAWHENDWRPIHSIPQLADITRP